MDDERCAVVNLGGVDYPLLLTVRATKEIAKRFGGVQEGLQELSKRLQEPDRYEEAIDIYIWLLTLLVNQSILLHNLQHKDDKKELLTEEYMELIASPSDIPVYESAITEALQRGSKRSIEGEDPERKNRKTG